MIASPMPFSANVLARLLGAIYLGCCVLGCSTASDSGVLEEESSGAYDCSVATPTRLLNVPSGFDSAATRVGDTVWTARGEYSSGEVSTLNLSQLARDATLQNTTLVGSGTDSGDSFSGTQIVATPSALLIFSQGYSEGENLQLAVVSLEGEVLRMAAALDALGSSVERYLVAVGSDDVALLWTDYSDRSLRFVRLSFDGVLEGEPELVQQGDPVSLGAITQTAKGYLFSYETEAQAQRFVRPIDKVGTLGAAVSLGQLPAGPYASHSMLARGNEVLLAWTDEGGSWDGMDTSRTTVLSRLDLEGERMTDDVRVQTPKVNVEHVDPRLLERDGDVGLLWSEGSVIYFCSGCMPDHRLRFVMLDGETLSPASDTLSLLNPASQGGLISPVGWWRGDDLSVVAAVGYHTSGEGAAATIRCVPR